MLSIKKNKEKILCHAWAESKNRRCHDRPLPGTKYCWRHYPWENFFLEFFLVILLTLMFNEPITWLITKVPLLRYIDREKPTIEKIIPDIDQNSQLYDKIDRFKVSFSDRYSGINIEKSTVSIQYMKNHEYVDIEGEINRTNSEINFLLKNKMEYGKYILNLLVTDKAENKRKRSTPFIVRPSKELNINLIREDFESSQYKDLFKDFNVSEKYTFFQLNHPEFIYVFSILSNKENIVNIEDLNFWVTYSGGILMKFEELGHIKSDGIKILNYFAATDKRFVEQQKHVYAPQKYIHIDKISPGGFVRFVVLAGKSPHPSESKFKNVWEGFSFNGTYFSEASGQLEKHELNEELGRIIEE